LFFFFFFPFNILGESEDSDSRPGDIGGGSEGGGPAKIGDVTVEEEGGGGGAEEDVTGALGDNLYLPKMVDKLVDKQVSGSSKIQLDGMLEDEDAGAFLFLILDDYYF
jgi:hypothetical protein